MIRLQRRERAGLLWRMEEPHRLREWAQQVPPEMREDPIWRMPAYRYALYLGDLVQADAPRIWRDIRTRPHLDQLLHAVGSISSNIAEGYSRSTGPDRARFFEYAYGSAREARDWLFKVRHALDPATFVSRIDLVSRIMRIIADVIPRERSERGSRMQRRRRDPQQHDG